MHEVSIANGILDRALEAAADHDADSIDTLTVEIGRATHVNPDQLVFCLEAIVESTPAEGAKIRTEPVDPVAACDCGWRDTPDTLDLAAGFAPDIRCPECGTRANLVQGKECRLTSIEIPDRNEATDGAEAGEKHAQETQ